MPRLTRVGVLLNRDNPVNVAVLRAMEQAAQALKLQLQAADAREPALVKGQAGAIVVQDDAMIFAQVHRIADLAKKHRVATIGFLDYVTAGGLLTFGVNFSDLSRRAAGFVDKILAGTKPGDLPFEQPTKFVLAVNLKTAKALGLTVPPSLLLRADQILE